MKKSLFSFLLAIFIAPFTFGQLDINILGTPSVVNFDTTVPGVNHSQFLAPNPFSTDVPAPGELDRNAFQLSETSGTSFNWPSILINGNDGEGLSPGAVSSGGVYAFTNDGGTNRFWGIQPTASQYTPGALILRARNNTGLAADGMEISYTGIGNSNATNEMKTDVYYSLDGSIWFQLGSLTFQTVPPSGWASNILSANVSGISIPDASYFYVKWVFSELGTGSRSELGLDDIRISLTLGAPCIQPPILASTALFVNGTDESSTKLGWTRGDGTNRILVLRENSVVSSLPINHTTYAASSSFGGGDDLGVGEYVVYNDNGDSVNLSGLEAGHTYYAALFEYNCSPGNELYLLSPATASFTTLPENIVNLDKGCMTNSSVGLSWSQATGEYDGILIFARENAPPAQPSVDASHASLSSPNSDYGATMDIGALGRLVYKGTGTSVEVTGLPYAANVVFKAYTYRFSTNTLWSDGTQRSWTIGLNEVDAISSLPGNQQLSLNWTNPSAASCYDEVLIVARKGVAVSASPSGDGSAYVADPVFGMGTSLSSGEFVVYKGTGTSTTINGLTNDTLYHFTAFVRKGNEWSSGMSLSDVPVLMTILEQGDLAVLSVNTDLGGGADEICFF